MNGRSAKPMSQPESDHGANGRRRRHRPHSNSSSRFGSQLIARKETGPAESLKGMHGSLQARAMSVAIWHEVGCRLPRERLAGATANHNVLCMATTERPTATVLVVEDRREVLDVLQRTLSDNGYSVLTADDGDSGLQMALDHRPDLVILDIGLPKRSGLLVARELRNRAFTAPVLMLTARDTVSDKVTGFDAGADDYLAKPFDYDELLARVKALLRRASIRAGETVMRIGDLVDRSDLARCQRAPGRKLALTQKEYALLEYLMRHAGIPVTREQISEQVWKQPFDPTTNIVDVYINYLRKKLETDGAPPLVHTVRGVGYVLRETGTGDT